MFDGIDEYKISDERLYNDTINKLYTIINVNIDNISKLIMNFYKNYVKLQLRLEEFVVTVYQPHNLLKPNMSLKEKIEIGYPDFIEVKEVVQLFNNLIIELNIKSIKKINYEYFNLNTNKRGLMLENDIMVEDGIVINSEKLDYTKEINDLIEYILVPEKRETYMLKEKIKRIKEK